MAMPLLSERRVLRGANGVFPVSRYTGALLSEDGVEPSRICVVPNGTDVERFRVSDEQGVRSSFRSKYDLGEGPIIGTVARLVERKGDAVIGHYHTVWQGGPRFEY